MGIEKKQEAADSGYLRGRGSQLQTANRFHVQQYVQDDVDGLDEAFDLDTATQFFEENPKKVISKNDSPDLSFLYSVNPYQGCEHGCVYCYARNSHEYWGLSAGLDFEKKIIVKRNVAAVMEQEFNKRDYRPSTIMLSGNTDCYQPIERKLELTRALLKTMLKYRHPVSLITKNSLITRDIDLLQALAAQGLVHVAITINSLDESLRQKMEPRTATAKKRLQVIRELHAAGIPVSLMCAPIIPGLNHDGIPRLIREAAGHGAGWVSYTVVRLNGTLSEIFRDWLIKAYPDRAKKVMNLIAACHGGKVNDSRWGDRMRGDGKIAEHIAQLVAISRRRYMGDRPREPLRTDLFAPLGGKQLGLF